MQEICRKTCENRRMCTIFHVVYRNCICRPYKTGEFVGFSCSFCTGSTSPLGLRWYWNAPSEFFIFYLEHWNAPSNFLFFLGQLGSLEKGKIQIWCFFLRPKFELWPQCNVDTLRLVAAPQAKVERVTCTPVSLRVLDEDANETPYRLLANSL